MNAKSKSPQPPTSTPEQLIQQHMAALQLANTVRTKRSTLKRDLKTQRISIRDVLLKPPEYISTMKIFDLLVACPKYGRIRVNTLLKTCLISASKPIGMLSERQRIEISSMMDP